MVDHQPPLLEDPQMRSPKLPVPPSDPKRRRLIALGLTIAVALAISVGMAGASGAPFDGCDVGGGGYGAPPVAAFGYGGGGGYGGGTAPPNESSTHQAA